MNYKKIDEFEQLVPFSPEAEACVLGCMILDAERGILPVVTSILTASDFFVPANAKIFQTIVDMGSSGIPVDLVSIRANLEKSGKLAEVGGIEYIVEIADGVPGTSNLEYYAKIVRERARLRGLLSMGREISTEAVSVTAEPEIVAQKAYNRLVEIMLDGTNVSCDAKTAFDQAWDEIQSRQDKSKTSHLIKTGITTFDRATGGIDEGDYTVLAGVTCTGKTCMALHIMANMCRQGCVCAYFSAEMPARQISTRLLQSEACVNGLNLRRGDANQWELDAIQEAKKAMADWKFEIVYGCKTAPEIMSLCRYFLHRYGRLDAVFIDYLQKMKGDYRIENKVERVSDFSGDIQTLAQTMRTRVFAVSQFAREVGKMQRKPEIFDLKGSGDIENDIDWCLLLHTPPHAETEKERYQSWSRGSQINVVGNMVWGKIAKARHGSPTLWSDEDGTINKSQSMRFWFYKPFTRFEEANPNLF